MSPFKIVMLLHYYAHARDYRDETDPTHAASEAVSAAIKDFLTEGLIHHTNPNWVNQYPCERLSEFGTTDKGSAMVEHLMAVQVPVCQWVQPQSTLPGSFPFTKADTQR